RIDAAIVVEDERLVDARTRGDHTRAGGREAFLDQDVTRGLDQAALRVLAASRGHSLISLSNCSNSLLCFERLLKYRFGWRSGDAHDRRPGPRPARDLAAAPVCRVRPAPRRGGGLCRPLVGGPAGAGADRACRV